MKNPKQQEHNTKTMVYLRSRRRILSQPGHPALTCLPDGNLLGNAFGTASQLQRFELHVHRDNDNNDAEQQLMYVTLKGSNGRYLSSPPNNSSSVVRCIANTVGDTEKWFLKNCGSQGDDACCVSIMSFHGRYLTNDNRFDCGKHITIRDEVVGMWSKWMIVLADNTNNDGDGDSQNALTCYSAGMTLRKYGAVVTTLFFPLVLGVAFIAMNQRAVAYGGSENTFFVLNVNDKLPPSSTTTATSSTKSTSEEEGDDDDQEGEGSSVGIVWIPLQLSHGNKTGQTAAQTVTETSKDVAHSITAASSTVAASISTVSSRAFSDCRGSKKSLCRDYDNHDGDDEEDAFVNSLRRQQEERKSLLRAYEMQALESNGDIDNNNNEYYSDMKLPSNNNNSDDDDDDTILVTKWNGTK